MVDLNSFRNTVKEKFPKAFVDIYFSMEDDSIEINWAIGFIRVDTGHEDIVFKLMFRRMDEIEYCINLISKDIKEFVL